MLTRLSIVVVTALAIALTACGDGDSNADPTQAPDGPTPAGDPTATAAAPSGAVELTWWGQAMFVVRSPAGTAILLDPYSDIGYRVPDPAELDVDAVTVSHEHSDHNNVALGGGATVLRGLTADGFAEIDQQVEGVRFRSVASFHDENDGADRGRNAIFAIEVDGITIVHLGDLGHTLTDEQIAEIGEVDVLLVPTGGFFTIDAAGATEVVAQLAPRVAIPMHFGTAAVAIPQLGGVDEFLDGKSFERFGSTVELTLDALPEVGAAEVWLLEPEGA